jgi:nitrogen regulatory protein PII
MDYELTRVHNVDQLEFSVLHLEHNCALCGVTVFVKGNDTGSSHELLRLCHCIPLEPGVVASLESQDLARDIEAIAFSEKAPGEEIYVVGEAYLGYVATNNMLRDLKILFPLSLVVVIAILYISFGSMFDVANKDRLDDILDAAEAAGSTGGTVIHGRGAGSQEKAALFNIEIEPEKVIVLILSQVSKTTGIVDAIRDKLDVHKPNTGIVFVMDVSRTFGLYEG